MTQTAIAWQCPISQTITLHCVEEHGLFHLAIVVKIYINFKSEVIPSILSSSSGPIAMQVSVPGAIKVIRFLKNQKI